ncbi:hypothetical protein B0H66DRAFT_59636 [Apodospora peruviana]|uniref:HMG box domain-containing protein n=1 Tax=Apodospora peruviana TaxID=516989 RepID=A0AAE0ITP1_9PEZI|nr:hypothetical protein B0H66DRAFT_59636 [Apodospora peruviana]
MWSAIGLATARQQLRVRGAQVARVARVAGRVPIPGPRLGAVRAVIFRRGYAAAAATTKKTATSTKGRKLKTTTSSAAAKRAAKPNVAKKKPVPKKTKKTTAKTKPAKKVLTPEQRAARKERLAARRKKDEIRDLRATALLHPPKALPRNAWAVFLNDSKKDLSGDVFSNVVPRLALAYKALSESEKYRLATVASQNQLANKAAYQSWILSHTPKQIHDANVARHRLNYLLKPETKFRSIKDGRLPKQSRGAYQLFMTSHMKNAAIQNLQEAQSVMRTAALQWKTLSESERQPYYDNARVDSARYVEEASSLGFTVSPRKSPSPVV